MPADTALACPPPRAQIYSSEDILKGKLSLLYPTNMVDFAMDIYKKLYATDEVPEGMVERRAQVVERLKQLEADTEPLRVVLDDAALVEYLRAEKSFTMAHLAEQHNVAESSLDTLFEWARFQHECGNYGGAAECLQHFRLLTSNPEAAFQALWGKLAAEILTQSWDAALDGVGRVREAIEQRAGSTPALLLLQQRCWLMHWSLYVFFNHENGRASLVDLFFQDRYLNALQTACPHLLRYLSVALVLTRRKRNLLRELTRLCVQETPNYSDPITQFVKALYHEMDFDGALAQLDACEPVMAHDFFLVGCRAEFALASKQLIFESYCKIHRRIDIGMVAGKLKMSSDDAERWVVNLVRDAHLDARIDSQEGHVVISAVTPSAYQKVLEKTEGLQFRSVLLANTLEQRSAEGGKAGAAAAK